MKILKKVIGVGLILIVLSAQTILAQDEDFEKAPPAGAGGDKAPAGGNDKAAGGGDKAPAGGGDKAPAGGGDGGAGGVNGTSPGVNGTATGANGTTSPKDDNTVAPTEFRGPAAWLRICGQGAKKYAGVVTTAKDECPAGYWFKDTFKVGCACGHGVWVFAKGWCDHTARIVVAHNGSCFNVNKDVKLIRHIGWSHNAFMPFHFVGSSGLEYIQDVPDISTMSGRATYYNYEYNQHIGSINRVKAVESMTGRVCLSQEGNKSRTLALKYFAPKLPYMQKSNCFGYAFQEGRRFEYDTGCEVKEGLTLPDAPNMKFEKFKPSEADAKKCAKECPAARGLTLKQAKNNSLAPDYVDPELDEYFLAELKATGWNDTSPLPTELPERKVSRFYTLTDKTTLEIQEQTKRILQLNLQSAIANGVAPGVKYPDYKLLQKARAVFDHVCPEEELPSTVLTGMLRMFRIIVNESLFHYPYKEVVNDEKTESIWKLLEQCATEAKPMKFVYFNSASRKKNAANTGNTNGTTTNGTTNGTAAVNETITTTTESPDSIEQKCEYTGRFIGVDYEFKSLNRTILARLPTHLLSNITDLDLVVETAWKTVMFSHYYCARHFKEASIDHSVFEQKMERFFNRWIQHRWFYPGKSYQGFTYLYQSYNLTRFALAMDRCVAAARSFSVYRKWLQRPAYLKFHGGKLFEEQYDIPDKIAGRTTLDAMNPELNQFGNKAYCLPFWHAPASNPGLNYKPENDYKPGCVKYKKEEWDNPFLQSSRGQGWKNTLSFR